MFCEPHAAEYNRNWNYFAGLSPEEAARRTADEETDAKGFRQSAQWKWAGPGDGTRTRDEMRALDALELESDADFAAVKSAHRRLVKETHPDANPGNEEAAKRFKQVQAAYDVLRKAEDRKNGKAA
jgi:DnaJ-domain-containing protein 1